MVLELLRSETGYVHRRLEDRLNMPEWLSSVDRYRALLSKFYGLYLGVEESEVVRGDGKSRAKTPLLVADLDALGLSADERAGLPVFTWPGWSEPEGLGAFYVIEGSTLGGRQISRMVKERLGSKGVTEKMGGAFFNGYGEQTGEMWKAACDWLEAESTRLNQPEAVVRGAVKTFEVFENWLCGPHS